MRQNYQQSFIIILRLEYLRMQQHKFNKHIYNYKLLKPDFGVHKCVYVQYSTNLYTHRYMYLYKLVTQIYQNKYE